MFKRIILGLCFLICTASNHVLADSAPISKEEIEEVESFFNSYIDSANNYNDDLINYYFENAEIKRTVLKANGEQEDIVIPMDRYKKELNKGKRIAKITKYKNRYQNRKYEKVSSTSYKIKALRFPRNDKIGLKAEFIIVKTPNGYKISKENMETTVQKFLEEK